MLVQESCMSTPYLLFQKVVSKLHLFFPSTSSPIYKFYPLYTAQICSPPPYLQPFPPLAAIAPHHPVTLSTQNLTKDIDVDLAALNKHLMAPYFAAIGKLLPEEGLVTKPLDIIKINPISGFNLRNAV